jgi:solute carrier family 25 carnitine/acylcarnitine transporter 20/29
MAAGALAGLSNGFVSGPVEHLRIRQCFFFSIPVRAPETVYQSGMQTQSSTNPLYSGPFDAVKKIASNHGLRGIFKGQTATFMREGLGFSVYFLAYEKLIQREMQTKGIRREDIPASNTILYGAAAGYAVGISPLKSAAILMAL